jgi:ABC-2 type transport system permease protein
MKYARYLFYQFKKDLSYLFLIFGVEVLSLAIMIILSRTSNGDIYTQGFFVYGVILAFMMAYLFPLIHKAKLYSKRSCDIYLSLPLSKKGIFIIDALLGLFELLLLFALFYSSGLLLAPLALEGKWIGAVWAGYFFLYGFLAILTAYGFGLGLTSCANNILDALIFLALGLVAMFGLTCDIASIYAYYYPANDYSSFYLIATYDYIAFPLSALTKGLVDRTYDRLYLYQKEMLPLYVNFIHLGLAIVVALLGYLASKKWKAEESQTPSLHWYGYPLLSALALTFYLGLSAPSLVKEGETATLFVIFGIGTLLYFIVYFIGQRKIRLSWRLLISYTASVSFGYIFAAILMAAFAH